MAEQRAVRLVGHSWMVAIPRRARAHLKLKVPGAVYWHVAGPREVVVSVRASRVGGKPAGLDLAPQLAAAEREVERLRRKLQARPLRIVNQGVAQGWMQAQRLIGPLDDRLEDLARKVDTLIEQRYGRPGDAARARRRRGRGTARRVEVMTLPDAIPSPSAPPSSAQPITCPECGALKLDDERCPSCGSSGGAAASGAERSQAAHE